MTYTVVIGLDGAGFELLEPWLNAGELPNLARIVDGGVAGNLRSVLPPVTSPNWKAYATGKNPGKLGVYWWYNVDTEDERVYLPNDRYHDHDEYWELLDDRERVGVVGVPTTYPPKSMGECVVSGAPDADASGFTSPSSLETELRSEFDYRPITRKSLDSGDEAAFEEVLDHIDTQFEVGKYLRETRELSLLQLTTFYVNALHHHRWDGEYSLRAWKIIDDHLGDFLDDGANVVLMSDHGHAEIERVFYVNTWLQEQGYLSFDARVASTLHSLGVTADRLKETLASVDERLPFDVQTAANRLAPRAVVDHLPNDRGEVGRGKIDTANWERTRAVASAQGPVYLAVDGPEREIVRDELLQKLSTLETPDGRPVAKAVYRGDEVYDGPYADEWPDVVVDKAPDVHVSDKVGSDEVFAREHDAWDGVNTRSGLFAATGPAFTTGDVDGLSILDLAPTLLHMHGEPVPRDMDGRVRADVFAEGSDPRTREVTFRDAPTARTDGG